MKKQKKSFIGMLGILLAAVLLLCSCSAKKENGAETNMSKAFTEAGVPLLKQTVSPRDFSLPLLLPSQKRDEQGEIQKLSDLKGKVVFLNFWATWCGPCRAEMPSMEALYSRYREKGFEILAVNSMERQPEVLAFKEENNFSFPIVLDGDGKVNSAYGIQAIPTTFLLDKEGKIVLRLVGSIDWDTPKFHAALELLLDS
jgi:thiol-disulfide isomerase/thioredoxin